MNARHKLNQSSVTGALFIAGVIGACTQSWTAFAVITAIFVGLAVHAGEIRLSPTARPRRHQGKR